MKKIVSVLALFVAGLFAQDNTAKPAPEQEKFYRLDFQVQELEGGKVVNTRSYSTLTMMAPGAKCRIRAGGKIPYTTGPNSWNYADVGVNVDCSSIHEHGSELSLNLNAEISSIMPAPEGVSNANPVIRQNRWESTVIVPLRKPTVIFSSDDPTGKRKMQLELTATAIL